MVGVPRSKGCRNCVQSRVKCDQTRPSCLRCQKRAVACPGYGPNLKFQDEGPRLQRHYEKKTRNATAGRRQTSGDGSQVGFIQLANGLVGMDDFLTSMGDSSTRLSTEDQSHLPADETTMSARSTGEPGLSLPYPSIAPHFSLPRTDIPLLDIVNSPQLMQTQLLSWYINSTTYVHTKLPGPKYQLEWLKECLQYHQSSALLSLAVRACALSHLGRLYQSEPLLRTSGSYYQSALRCLARTLSEDGREAKSSLTLAATLFLSIYEMYTCTTSFSWVKHAGGAGALMQLRGAHSHRTGFDRAMYLAVRNILIVEAFEAGKPCFLNEPEWRQLDEEFSMEFANSSPLILPMERFYAEFVRVPGFCSDTQAALRHKGSGEGYAKVLRDLMCRGLAHRSALAGMLARFEKSLEDTTQWLATVPNPDQEDTVFPEIYDFSDMFIGVVVCGTRNTLSVIMMEMLDISNEYSQTFADSVLDKVVQPAKLRDGFEIPKLTSREMIYQELLDHARKGCMSVPWMGQSNFIGPFFATFALRLARRTLRSQLESRWIRTKMVELGRKMGIASPDVLPNEQVVVPPGFARRSRFGDS